MTLTAAYAMANFSVQQLWANRYIKSLSTLVLFFIIAKLIYSLGKTFLKKATKKTETQFDDILLEKYEGPVALLILLVGVKLALRPLQIGGNLEAILQNVVSSLNVLVVGYLVIILFDLIIEHWGKSLAAKTESKGDDQIISISHKFIRFIVLLISIMFLMQVWGIQIGPLLASLGIVGIAVAFGLQNTLGNIFGGISLIIDRTLRVGDVVKVGNDTRGVILDVGLRATRIRTWNNEVVIIPNGELANGRILNYVLPTPIARIEVPFSVAYGSDINQVKKIVMKIIKKLDNLDKNNEPKVLFLEMANSSLNFRCHVWLTSYKDRFSTKEQLNCDIYNALNKAKITIPFPQMDVHVRDHKKSK